MTLLMLYGLMLFAIVLASALFAGSETAIASLSRQIMQQMADQKPRTSVALKFWQDNPSQVLTFLLIGNNAVNIGAGVVAASCALQIHAMFGWPKELILVIFPLFVTLLILFAGEILPKVYGRQYAEGFSAVIIGPIVASTRLGRPVISWFVRFSDWLIRIFGGQKGGDQIFITRAELKHILSAEQESALPPAEALPSDNMQLDMPPDTKRMLKNLIDFSNIRVGEIMVPRTQIFALDIKLGIRRIIQEVLEQRYSRVPVFDGTVDNIVGILYAKDLIASLKHQELLILQDLIRPVYYIPEIARVSDVMWEFKTGRHHLAVVVDQYGGTVGLVTIEDIVEEIVGEIYDEFDERGSAIIYLGDGGYAVQADVSLQHINEKLGFQLPEDQYETLAELVLDVYGRIPRNGERKQYGEYELIILEADRRRVTKIKIRKQG